MNAEFIEALREIVKEKGISEEMLYQTVEDALLSAYKKNFSKQGAVIQNAKVTINRETGEIHVYTSKEVVDEVDDTINTISIEDATSINPTYEIGDIVDIEVTPKKFGRIAAQTAKQVVIQRIKEAERKIIYDEFIAKEFDIITGTVIRKEKGNVFIDLSKIEAILGTNEQVKGENYNYNDKLKLYIVEVKNTTKGPQIVVSRSHPGLVKRLFELEVPEIYNGVVEIKSIAREAGSRTKIAVYSNDNNVDATGSCVGPRGSRVQTIVDELNNEKIDIIKFDKLPEVYIANSLSPAKVERVDVDMNSKSAKVVVANNQLSLAIGKEGQNVRLAAKLTGWKIDIASEAAQN
ncbi:transcription termination factor NusA [Clostridium sp. DL1XJH146]